MPMQTVLPLEGISNEQSSHETVLERIKAIGGNYIPNFIDENDEKELLASIDNEKWITDLKRRVQHYGYRYDYKARTIDAKDKIGDLPEWAGKVIEKLMAGAEPVFKQKPDQIIVNEYEPEQGIAPHTDRDCFGPVLASLSLGGEGKMKIKHPGDKSRDFTVRLEPRSLIVFRGESRERWKHGLQMNKNAKRRVSLTFRTVLQKQNT